MSLTIQHMMQTWHPAFFDHTNLATAVSGLLFAKLQRVGRGIPVCDDHLGIHGITGAGLRPGLVMQNREKLGPSVALQSPK